MAITLVGGGPVDPAALARALARAPRLIAADGGADRALALGHRPAQVIGDLDSLSAETRAALPPESVIACDGQDDTDFDKALAATRDDLVLAVGFTGGRFDHTLAALSTLARHPDRRVILDTGEDLCLLCPPRLTLDLPAATRVSLYPLAALRCRSTGLRWATDDLVLDPFGRIGTSNRATGGAVSLAPEGPALLVMVPVRWLDGLIAALALAPAWPAPARGQ